MHLQRHGNMSPIDLAPEKAEEDHVEYNVVQDIDITPYITRMPCPF